MRTSFFLLAVTISITSFSQEAIRVGTRFYDVLETANSISPLLIGELNVEHHQIYLGLGGINRQTNLDRESRTVFTFGFNPNPIDSIMDVNPIRQRSYSVIVGYARRISISEQWNLLPGLELAYFNSRFTQNGDGRVTQNAPPNQLVTVFSFNNEMEEESFGIRPTLMVERVITPAIRLSFGTQLSFALTESRLDQNSEQTQTFGNNQPNTTSLFIKESTREFYAHFSPLLIGGIVIQLVGEDR